MELENDGPFGVEILRAFGSYSVSLLKKRNAKSRRWKSATKPCQEFREFDPGRSPGVDCYEQIRFA